MKTKFTKHHINLFLEKRLVYKSPEKKAPSPESKEAQDKFKKIEKAVKDLEKGKENKRELVKKLAKLIIDPETSHFFSPKLLKALARREEVAILKAVAQNPNTPISTLKEFASDSKITSESEKDRSVLVMVVQNPKLPLPILAKIVNGKDQSLKSFTALNPGLTEPLLQKLASDLRLVKINLPQNPKLPKSIYQKLVNDKDSYVRMSVATGPYTPKDILKKLAANDSDKSVRDEAKKKLEK